MFGNISESEIEMFDKFSERSMSADEYEQFTELLSQDENLRNKFKLYQILVLKIAEDSATNELLKNRFVQVSQRSKVFYWIRLIVGAAAVIVLGFFGVKQFSNQKLDYTRYSFNDPGLPINMSTSDKSSWSQFSNAYAIKDYSECIKTLASIPSTDTSIYYRGLCNELKGNLDIAIQEYSKIQWNPSSIYSQKAAFRSAIIYLQKEDKSKAINSLERFNVDSNSPFKKQAEELLKLINGKK